MDLFIAEVRSKADRYYKSLLTNPEHLAGSFATPMRYHWRGFEGVEETITERKDLISHLKSHLDGCEIEWEIVNAQPSLDDDGFMMLTRGKISNKDKPFEWPFVHSMQMKTAKGRSRIVNDIFDCKNISEQPKKDIQDIGDELIPTSSREKCKAEINYSLSEEDGKTTLGGGKGTGTLSFKVHNCQEDPSLWQFKVLKRIKSKHLLNPYFFDKKTNRLALQDFAVTFDNWPALHYENFTGTYEDWNRDLVTILSGALAGLKRMYWEKMPHGNLTNGIVVVERKKNIKKDVEEGKTREGGTSAEVGKTREEGETSAQGGKTGQKGIKGKKGQKDKNEESQGSKPVEKRKEKTKLYNMRDTGDWLMAPIQDDVGDLQKIIMGARQYWQQRAGATNVPNQGVVSRQLEAFIKSLNSRHYWKLEMGIRKVNDPLFWYPQKRIDFMNKMYELAWQGNKCSMMLYNVPTGPQGLGWIVKIKTHPVLLKVFDKANEERKKIGAAEKGKDGKPPRPGTQVAQVAPYAENLADLIRFWRNCQSHYVQSAACFLKSYEVAWIVEDKTDATHLAYEALNTHLQSNLNHLPESERKNIDYIRDFMYEFL